MKVAIVKYNGGNTASVANALIRLGVEPLITDAADELRSADKVIFPGVGEASTAMKYLRERGLDEVIRSLTQPVLGICLGMQLMCETSDENATECLGIMPYRVRRFESDTLKIPHTGWNRITELDPPLFTGVADGERVYFVHSYYVDTPEPALVTGESDYPFRFTCAVGKDNVFATQFHPEKSHNAGLQLLKNFVLWDGQA